MVSLKLFKSCFDIVGDRGLLGCSGVKSNSKVGLYSTHGALCLTFLGNETIDSKPSIVQSLDMTRCQ